MIKRLKVKGKGKINKQDLKNLSAYDRKLIRKQEAKELKVEKKLNPIIKQINFSTAYIFSQMHELLGVTNFNDPYNVRIIRILFVFIKILGYYFYQSFLYTMKTHDLYLKNNKWLKATLIYPAIGLTLNNLVCRFLKQILIDSKNFVFYFYA